MDSAHIKITVWTVGGIIFTMFFAVFFVGALYTGADGPAAVFALFLFLCALLLLAYGPILSTGEEIAMLSPSGVYAIRWDEIRRIEYGQSHLVFVGDNKRLTVPNPMFWTGKDKKLLIEAFGSFCHQTGITPTKSFLADFKLSKNARKSA